MVNEKTLIDLIDNIIIQVDLLNTVIDSKKTHQALLGIYKHNRDYLIEIKEKIENAFIDQSKEETRKKRFEIVKNYFSSESDFKNNKNIAIYSAQQYFGYFLDKNDYIEIYNIVYPK